MQTTCILLVGQSGAGKSTALHVFEDLRMFTADGVPLAMLPEMIRMLCDPTMSSYKQLALGVDQRCKHFVTELQTITQILQDIGIQPQLLFLQAEKEVILRRYATTRRPHPLERQALSLEKAVNTEIQMLAEVRRRADVIIDTSHYSIHDLRRDIQRRWASTPASGHLLQVNLISFGFKYGTPHEADMIFDLRFLPNPHFTEGLRPLSGKDKPVYDFLFNHSIVADFLEQLTAFLLFVLPHMEAEGRYRVSIALGCTGGRHRSVALTQELVKRLKQHGYPTLLEHRHMTLANTET